MSRPLLQLIPAPEGLGVGSVGSIDMALAFLGAVRAVVGGVPSVGGIVGTDEPLVFEGVAELEDCIFAIGRVGGLEG